MEARAHTRTSQTETSVRCCLVERADGGEREEMLVRVVMEQRREMVGAAAHAREKRKESEEARRATRPWTRGVIECGERAGCAHAPNMDMHGASASLFEEHRARTYVVYACRVDQYRVGV